LIGLVLGSIASCATHKPEPTLYIDCRSLSGSGLARVVIDDLVYSATFDCGKVV
jgi:hypothetical protein